MHFETCTRSMSLNIGECRRVPAASAGKRDALAFREQKRVGDAEILDDGNVLMGEPDGLPRLERVHALSCAQGGLPLISRHDPHFSRLAIPPVPDGAAVAWMR
jgi:hypothetical protein